MFRRGIRSRSDAKAHGCSTHVGIELEFTTRLPKQSLKKHAAFCHVWSKRMASPLCRWNSKAYWQRSVDRKDMHVLTVHVAPSSVTSAVIEYFERQHVLMTAFSCTSAQQLSFSSWFCAGWQDDV